MIESRLRSRGLMGDATIANVADFIFPEGARSRSQTAFRHCDESKLNMVPSPRFLTNRRLEPEHPTQFIYLTRRRSRNAISLAGFQVIFGEPFIPIEHSIVGACWTQRFRKESSATIPTQATPIDAASADDFRESFSRARGADTRSSFHTADLPSKAGKCVSKDSGVVRYMGFGEDVVAIRRERGLQR